MMRIMAMRTKAAAMRAWRSKSRARRRWWLIQPSVRSTVRGAAPNALGQHDKAVSVAAAHDLDLPSACAGRGSRHLGTLVAGIADDALDERKQPSRLAQQGFRAVAVLHAGRMHHDTEQQPQRIGQDVALAPDDLLARVITGRIKRRAPFCAPFAVWLSMMAVVGLASRPACSRTAT
jgi:hypothetical protein